MWTNNNIKAENSLSNTNWIIETINFNVKYLNVLIWIFNEKKKKKKNYHHHQFQIFPNKEQ